MGSDRIDSRRFWTALGLAAAALVAVAVTIPLVWTAPIELRRVLAGQSPDFQLMVELRLPRVLLAMLAGAVQALAEIGRAHV